MNRINYVSTIEDMETLDSGSGSSNISGSRNSGDNSWLGSIISNAGGWMDTIFGGITSITQAKTGNYPTVQQDNTPKVLAIAGVGAVVLIVVLLIIFKK